MYTTTGRMFISSTTFLTGTAGPAAGLQTDKKNGYPENEVREAAEIADALDRYKLLHRRRYVSFEEMIGILRSLGYRRT